MICKSLSQLVELHLLVNKIRMLGPNCSNVIQLSSYY